MRLESQVRLDVSYSPVGIPDPFEIVLQLRQIRHIAFLERHQGTKRSTGQRLVASPLNVAQGIRGTLLNGQRDLHTIRAVVIGVRLHPRVSDAGAQIPTPLVDGKQALSSEPEDVMTRIVGPDETHSSLSQLLSGCS